MVGAVDDPTKGCLYGVSVGQATPHSGGHGAQPVVRHRGTEDSERESYFFVYREIPTDEKTLSNRIHDTVF